MSIDEVESELSRFHTSRSTQLSEIISLSHRISGYASAPSNYITGNPLPRAFKPPAPQMEEIRASILFQSEEMERVPKPEIKILPTDDPELLKVEISCKAEMVSIKYTMDGSVPTEALGTVYIKPILIEDDADCVIKAVATKPGFMESEIAVLSRADPQPPKPAFERGMERPTHVMQSGVLDLGFGYSPPSSSRYSDDDEFRSPSLQ